METEKRDKRILTIGSQLKSVVEAFSKDGNVDVDHIWFMNVSTALYEEGVSAMDIIKYLDEDLNIPKLHSQLIRLKFCFNKIKGEFRCEKMLMMYLFDFLFLRSNPSLKNVSFL